MRTLLLAVVAWSCVSGCAAEAGDEGAVASDFEEEAPAVLHFGADWSTRVTGVLRAGRTVRVVYDAARAGGCAASTGGRPAFATTGYARLADGETSSFWAAGNAPFAGAKSELVLPKGRGGDLALWFETNNRWGCHTYDSNYGANYHFDVRESLHLPDWIGAGTVTLARSTCEGGPCEADRLTLERGFSYDTWARERAAIRRIEFRVYEPGLTDRDDPELWKKLEATVHYRFGGAGAYRRAFVSLDGRIGNDARYALDLTELDPLAARAALADRAACPSFALQTSPDGQTVSTGIDYWFEVEGAALRPEGGGTFTGSFANYASLYSVCAPR